MNEQAGHDARGREQAAARAAPEAGAQDEHRVGAGSQGQKERGGQEECVELRIDDRAQEVGDTLTFARYCSGTASMRSVQYTTPCASVHR